MASDQQCRTRLGLWAVVGETEPFTGNGVDPLGCDSSEAKSSPVGCCRT